MDGVAGNRWTGDLTVTASRPPPDTRHNIIRCVLLAIAQIS